MRCSNTSRFISSSLVLALAATTLHATITVEIGSPAPFSEWQHNANMLVSGNISWEVGDRQPMDAGIYLHVGGLTGTVTNSGLATLTQINEEERWGVYREENFEVVPQTPHSPTQPVSYTLEVDAMWKGVPMKQGNPPAPVLRTVQIRVREE